MKKCMAIIALLLTVLLITACHDSDEPVATTSGVPEKYLPIGSVVLLVDGTQPLMIYARAVEFDSGEVRDYSAVLYPFGYLGSDYVYSFDHSDIESVLHLGYVSDDEVDANRVLIENAK